MSADLWGPSKNTLLYLKPTTLRVHANGYAVLTSRDRVQRVVSEFAAFCKTPTPFPPGFKVVDVPPAEKTDAQAPPPPGSDTGRWALLLTAVALALAWLAYKTITRPAAESSDGESAADAAAKAAEKPAEPPADKPADDKPSDDKPST